METDVDVPKSERRDFRLFVDEFQSFATDPFASILFEARGRTAQTAPGEMKVPGDGYWLGADCASPLKEGWSQAGTGDGQSGSAYAAGLR